MNSAFKVGDTVIVIYNLSRNCPSEIVNKIGKVKIVSSTLDSIGVEFDFSFSGGHDLNGTIKYGHGYYLTEKSLRLAEKLLAFN